MVNSYCFLVVDEAYYHFGSQTAVPLIKKFNNVIILRTFSKAFGLASLRLGYCISSKENISLINKFRNPKSIECTYKIWIKKKQNYLTSVHQWLSDFIFWCEFKSNDFNEK